MRVKGASRPSVTTGTSFSLVSTKGRDRGSVWISFNGTVNKTNLHSSGLRGRQVVWQSSWSGLGPVAIPIFVPSGHGRVDLDAFGVVK